MELANGKLKPGRHRVNTSRASPLQKKMLIEFVTQNPELIACKVTPEFNYDDSRRLWQGITKELNATHGAVKTWRQWRKTWQDLRSKTKKSQGKCVSLETLTPAEQEVLGIKNITDSEENSTEFVRLESVDIAEHAETEMFTIVETETPESKVFSQPQIKTNSHGLEHNSCSFNCNQLAKQEERKVQLKEDYINFRKDYLRQKLELLREQTDALKAIAKGLSDSKK